MVHQQCTKIYTCLSITIYIILSVHIFFFFFWLRGICIKLGNHTHAQNHRLLYVTVSTRARILFQHLDIVVVALYDMQYGTKYLGL